MELAEFVALSVKHNATDLHLCSGDFPRWRRFGLIELIPGGLKIKVDWFELFIQSWLSPRLIHRLDERGDCDGALDLDNGFRVRISLFKQRGGFSLAARILNSRLFRTAELSLPKIISQLVTSDQGLVVVTGASGTGKSTTLAAMINLINISQRRHIITLEDPIEFQHQNQQSLIQQREIGEHLTSYHCGLQSVLRQDPDVILLGEAREARTIQLALTAAETGHLVFTTLHSGTVVQALERLINAFPPPARQIARTQLAESLTAIIAQRLIYPQQEVVPLFEVLVNTSAIAGLIREGKNHQINALLELSHAQGMCSFAQSSQQHHQTSCSRLQDNNALSVK